MTDRKQLVISYFEKYNGEISKNAMAKIMFEENKDIFKTKEYARSCIRVYTGNKGVTSRNNSENDKQYFFHKGEKEIEQLTVTLEKENSNILILSDIHIPFHNEKALQTALEYGYKHSVDTIYLNGDIFDYYGESKFDKNLRKTKMEADYEKYNDFLFDLRDNFPDTDIYFKVGNHENRYYNAIKRNPQLAHLLAIKHFLFEEIFNFDEYGIKIIEDYQTFRVANKNIVHGHEVRGGGMFVARWLALRFFEDTICGHFHHTDTFVKKLANNNHLRFDAIGCLCDLNPRYMPYNEWNHGFGHLIKNGNETELLNIRINKSGSIQ